LWIDLSEAKEIGIAAWDCHKAVQLPPLPKDDFNEVGVATDERRLGGSIRTVAANAARRFGLSILYLYELYIEWGLPSRCVPHFRPIHPAD